MMTYNEAVSYIESVPMFTKKHTLDHTKQFLKYLGSPERGQKIIHVAGTNGKGSVCAYLQAMLMGEGKTVGFFTSPHLVKINERIQLNGKQIDDETFLKIFRKVKKIVDQMGDEGIAHPSYFEFLFGMGMVAFAESKPDYIIMETGLGGRLDATNAIEEPLMTIITSISLDHTKYLGTTIPEIAMEKAGIIKKNAFLIYDGSNEEAAEVIRNQAELSGIRAKGIVKSDVLLHDLSGNRVLFSRVGAKDEGLEWALQNSGIYQMMNGSIAICAMEYIHDNNCLPEQYACWKEALSNVTWEGRMEEVLPNVYLDGAHNPGAIEAFCDSIEEVRKIENDAKLPVLMFSAVADKEYDYMIRMLCERVPAKLIVVTEVEDGRKISAEVLQLVFGKYSSAPVIAEKDVVKAWNIALSHKDEEEKMYCLGSLYLVGMIKEKILAEV